MKKIVLAILLISGPAWAQTKPSPKSVPVRVDNRAPIGQGFPRMECSLLLSFMLPT